jgi:hypothetical protein
MLRLSFSVEDADGPRNVNVGPATLVAWERKTGRKLSSFSEGIGAEDMAWLVWHADKRAGNVKTGFEEYLETIVDLSDAPVPKATSDEGPSAD